MFYLIDEKDELFEQKILVNSLNLKSIEVLTGKNDYTVRFVQKDDENLFTFKPDNIFNVSQVISNFCQQQPVTLANSFITVTDVDNVNNITERFGSFSPIMNKVSKILINIHDFGLVYEKDGKYIISVSKKNITIAESPEEIYHQILSKILQSKNNVADNKQEYKKKL